MFYVMLIHCSVPYNLDLSDADTLFIVLQSCFVLADIFIVILSLASIRVVLPPSHFA
jgi:hypothetical protein